MATGGVISSTTPTPKSAKFSSVLITDGLEIQGTFVNNALQTSQDSLSLTANKLANQTFGDGTPGDVTFPTVVGTAPSAWDTAGDINYTAPVSGLYSVTANITWDVSVVGSRQLFIFVNGSAVTSVDQVVVPGGVTAQSLSGIFPVTAGQIIKIQATNLGVGAGTDVTAGSLKIQLVRRTA